MLYRSFKGKMGQSGCVMSKKSPQGGALLQKHLLMGFEV